MSRVSEPECTILEPWNQFTYMAYRHLSVSSITPLLSCCLLGKRLFKKTTTDGIVTVTVKILITAFFLNGLEM